MIKTNDYVHVFEQLKISIDRAVSLYQYAPVFKVRINDDFFVLKRTKNDEAHVNKLMVFQKHLKSHDIDVQIPVKRFDQETHMIEEMRWVLYPFVEGEPYNGSLEHIQLAGDMLGKIHACNNDIFNHGFTWKNYEGVFLTDIMDDLKTIETKYGDQEVLSVMIEEAISNKFDTLKALDLPYVDASWDYKAANLLYNDHVRLIDLDNSGYIPRVFDLALALLLFHTDAPLAPARPFTVEEWAVFMDAYKGHVQLTEAEILCFNEFLKFVFLDEALYAIVDMEEDADSRQKDFISNLLKMDLEQYKI